MFYRVRAGLLAGLAVSLIAGCAYLPQGFSPRTSHAPADDDRLDSEALFIDTGAVQTGNNQSPVNLQSTPMQGLQIRQSKRGNMDSYVVRGQRYFTLDSSDGYSARGLASWYGPNFHGRVASNGEVYDMYRLTAAHKTLPLPTYARVTHIDSGKSIVVKINDRGPFSGDRLIDLSFAAALELGMVNDGTAMVEIKALSPEELLVMSGPENKMGIDFYYDYSAPARGKPKVAMDSLFVDDRNQQKPAVADSDQPMLAPVSVAVPAPPSAPELPPISEVTAANGQDIPVAVSAESAEGTVVEVASVEADFIEVVVPGRNKPQNAADQDSGMFAGMDIELKELAKEQQQAVAEGRAQRVAVPLIETAAVPAGGGVALPAIATVAQPKPAVQKPQQAGISAMNLRYYLQAGVFANVNDAERVATNIVLEIPREEVHVKPLKNSAMYRVTVGPIVNKDHAQEVSVKLDTAGIENYTVKVNES